MKIRKFQINDNSATISSNGDFLHINDVILLLKEERESIQKLLDVIPDEGCGETEWNKKSRYAHKSEIELLDKLIKKIYE